MDKDQAQTIIRLWAQYDDPANQGDGAAKWLENAITAENPDPVTLQAFIDAALIPREKITDVVRTYLELKGKAKLEADARKATAKAQNELGKAEEILSQLKTNLENGVPVDSPEMLKAAADIGKHISTLSTPQTAQGLTQENLHAFGSAEGFPIAFWNGLKIPSPGATVIGARTGGGKTSALVNVARELLDQGRKVCLISYEMNAQELGLALQLSIMAKSRTEPIENFLPDTNGPGERLIHPEDYYISGDKEDLFADYFSNLKTYIMQSGTPDFLKAAERTIINFLASGTLVILDTVGDADALARYVMGTDFDAYLVDYVQAITPPKDGPAEGFRRVGAITDRLRGIVNAGKKTLILGAQFNRESGDGDGLTVFDPVAEQFREAADVEQLATMALGVGWIKDREGNKIYFWKVLKHRFNGVIRDAKMLSHGQFKYYLNQRGGPWLKPQDWAGLQNSFLPSKQSTKRTDSTPFDQMSNQGKVLPPADLSKKKR